MIKKILVEIYNFTYYTGKKLNKSVSTWYFDIRTKISNKNLVLNKKQENWLYAMKKLDKKSDLIVLETGRIRNPQWRTSDGNSTYFFAKNKRVKKLISVDNDSENFSGLSTSMSYCEKYIPKKYLNKIEFINNDSVKAINALPKEVVLDFVLLDSANDPQLIYNEYQAVKKNLNPKGSIVVIDDVTLPGIKGDLLIPYLVSQGYTEHKMKAYPNDCSYFKM